MPEPVRQSDAESPWDTASGANYEKWRDEKISRLSKESARFSRVEIADISNPTVAEKSELVRRCANSNAAFYVCKKNYDGESAIRSDLQRFAVAMGLRIAESHRSAGSDGIVALRQNQEMNQKGYIPYSKRPMNWHTDGYYNGADQKIRAMVLHCSNAAKEGGINQFLDPEIAYIRIRDENPDYIDALMHREAMTIPENCENDGSVRPASVGPVFSVSTLSGKLEMRYTARTRSIRWRQDPVTQQAVKFLNATLKGQEPYIQTTKLKAGEGVICNNSLHNRTGFDPDTKSDSERCVFRIRFHNRVPGS